MSVIPERSMIVTVFTATPSSARIQNGIHLDRPCSEPRVRDGMGDRRFADCSTICSTCIRFGPHELARAPAPFFTGIEILFPWRELGKDAPDGEFGSPVSLRGRAGPP